MLAIPAYPWTMRLRRFASESCLQTTMLLAATTIVKLDLSRTDLLPGVRDSTMSDHLVVRSLSRQFLFK